MGYSIAVDNDMSWKAYLFPAIPAALVLYLAFSGFFAFGGGYTDIHGNASCFASDNKYVCTEQYASGDGNAEAKAERDVNGLNPSLPIPPNDGLVPGIFYAVGLMFFAMRHKSKKKKLAAAAEATRRMRG